MFSKPVRETSASLTDVEFMAFATGYSLNNVRGSACEIKLDNKFGFGSKNDECFCCAERKSLTNVFVIVWYTVPLNKIHHYQLALFLAVEPAVTQVLFFVKPPLFLDPNLNLLSGIISYALPLTSFTAYPTANAMNSTSVRLTDASLTGLPSIFVP